MKACPRCRTTLSHMWQEVVLNPPRRLGGALVTSMCEHALVCARCGWEKARPAGRPSSDGSGARRRRSR